MTNLYQQSRQELWDYCASEHNLSLLDSEEFDLWATATRSCRDEIKRLERLLRFRDKEFRIAHRMGRIEGLIEALQRLAFIKEKKAVRHLAKYLEGVREQ